MEMMKEDGKGTLYINVDRRFIYFMMSDIIYISSKQKNIDCFSRRQTGIQKFVRVVSGVGYV